MIIKTINKILEKPISPVQRLSFKLRLISFIQSSNFILFKPVNKLIDNYNHYKTFKNHYILTKANRAFSLEFLRDNLSNKFDFKNALPFYEDKKSILTLQKLVRNKTLCATHLSINQNSIFSKEDIIYSKKIKSILRKNIKQSNEQIKAFGYVFKEKFEIESSVFIEKCGVSYLSAEIIKKINTTNSVIVDCGAYVGDSSFMFNSIFPSSKIYGFEPSEYNYSVFKENIKLNDLQNLIIPVKSAVGENNKIIKANIGDGLNANIKQTSSVEAQEIKVDLIDVFFKNKKVSLIKMDIEGFELNALKGAVEILKRDKPILLISLYHKAEDIYTIPKFIKELNLGYSFILRHLKPQSPTIDYMLICEVK